MPRGHPRLHFIPYYPFWSIIAIIIGVFVILAVAAHGRELRDASA